MSLWVDKYRPSSLARLDYHKEQAAQLRNLVQCGDFPHLLVYGPSGAGKKTRIMCILRELYGIGVEKLRIEHQTITTPSKKKKLKSAPLQATTTLKLIPVMRGTATEL